MKKITLTKNEYFWHYSPIIFCLFIPIITSWNIFQYSILNTYSGVRTIREMSIGYLFLIPAIVFLILQRNRLKFKSFNISVSKEVFESALKKTALELDWSIETKEKGFIKAHRGWNWSSSWGEMITIRKLNNEILINSICDPNAVFMSLVSYGWNKKNVRTFMKNIEDCKKEESKLSLQ